MQRFGLVLTALLLIGGLLPADAQEIDKLQKTIVDLETRTWQAMKNKDVATLKTILVEDSDEIVSGAGLQSRAQFFRSVPDWDIKSFAFENVKVRLLAKDVALLTYRLKLDARFKGKGYLPRAYVSVIYVQRGGAWKNTFYQETPIDDK